MDARLEDNGAVKVLDLHCSQHHGFEGWFASEEDFQSWVRSADFRAGHAHAGVLVTLGIIGQIVLDQSRVGEGLVWALRIALLVAPLLISGGFFGGAPRTAGGSPASLIRLVPIGAALFGLATLGVGIGLLIPE